MSVVAASPSLEVKAVHLCTLPEQFVEGQRGGK